MAESSASLKHPLANEGSECVLTWLMHPFILSFAMDPTPARCCRILSCKVALLPIEVHKWKTCPQHLEQARTGMKRKRASDASSPRDSIRPPPRSPLHIRQGTPSIRARLGTPSITGKETVPLTSATASDDRSDRPEKRTKVRFSPSFIYPILLRYECHSLVAYSSYKIWECGCHVLLVEINAKDESWGPPCLLWVLWNGGWPPCLRCTES